MIARIIRLRASLDLPPEKKPLVFLSRATSIHDGIAAHPDLFPGPSPALPLLFQQIQDAAAAQQTVGKIVNASATRNAKFAIVRTSLESERMMVQSLCDVSPEMAAELIAAASMTPFSLPSRSKPLLALANALPSGTVLAEANASLLDSSQRRKTFNWQMTLDGKTFLQLPSTPVARTSITALAPLAIVGVQVSVSVHKQPPGPWSPTITILVR